MEKIVAANLKMNMSLDDTDNYIRKLKNRNHGIVVFPSSIYLSKFLDNEIGRAHV